MTLFHSLDVSKWENIVAISVGNQEALGLKADGTVVYATSNSYYDFLNKTIGNWTDIIAIEAGQYDRVGICFDGKVYSGEGFYD